MNTEQLVELIENTGLLFFEICLILLIVGTLTLAVLGSVVLWKEAKKIICPAMNTKMYLSFSKRLMMASMLCMYLLISRSTQAVTRERRTSSAPSKASS